MQSFDLYFAFGDSMSIDKYAGAPGLGAASLLYRNRDDIYPDFRGRDLVWANAGVRFRLLAEDGQASPELERVVAHLPPPGTHRGGPPRTLITVTVGGNDLLLWWSSGTRTVQDAMRHLSEFSARMDRVFDRLRSLFEKSVMLLGNVYDPTDGTGRLQSGGNLEDGLPLLDAMNETIGQIAHRNGALLVDVHGHFLGHGIRHADRSYRHHHRDDPSGWYVFDIEPNQRGSSEIRRLFVQALAAGGVGSSSGGPG